MATKTGVDPYGQVAFPMLHVENPKSEPNFYMFKGQLRCGSCEKRIPQKHPGAREYKPKYPHCPWCGAKMEE